MGLNSRLKRLEERNPDVSPEEREDVVRRKTLTRVTTEDLHVLDGYLGEAGEPTEEEEAALLRYERLREEVIHELDAKPSA